jgi:hypothetical protein
MLPGCVYLVDNSAILKGYEMKMKRMMLVAGLFMVLVSLIHADEKSNNNSPMLLSIYHSNDYMGYLTPCG